MCIEKDEHISQLSRERDELRGRIVAGQSQLDKMAAHIEKYKRLEEENSERRRVVEAKGNRAAAECSALRLKLSELEHQASSSLVSSGDGDLGARITERLYAIPG